MKMRLEYGLCVTVITSIAILCFGQGERKSTASAGQTVVLSGNEVVVDVVVRDKKGRVATDLSAKDFQVYEDNAPQKIESFRFVSSEPSVCDMAGNKQSASLIAMVFDRLSPESCLLAYKAAIKYVSETARPNDFVGIFGANLSLQIFQPYTNQVELIKGGITRALSQCASGAYASGKASSQTPMLQGGYTSRDNGN